MKLLELYKQGRIHGVIGAGGSSNTSIAAAAMRDLPRWRAEADRLDVCVRRRVRLRRHQRRDDDAQRGRY